MGLDDIVSVSISSSSKSPTRPGFGTPMLLVQNVPAGWGTAKSRLFGSLTELIDAGFTTSDAAYKMAAKLKAQNPSVKNFRVGKRATSQATQIIKLTVTNATEDYEYSFKVDGTELTYTVLAAATTSTVATALAALISALSNVNAAAVGPVITITGAAAGTVYDVEGWAANDMTLENTTVDAGLATDLAAIWAENSDWYGLALDMASEAEILVVAAWVESNKRIFAARTSDAVAADSVSTTDVLYLLKSGNYFRTYCQYGEVSLQNYEDVALLGSRLPATPGSDTWVFKTLAATTVSDLTEGKKSAVFAKNGGTYTEVSGLSITEGGKGSGGEWMDVIRFIDWLEAEIKVRVFAALANSPKLPYTNAGRDVLLAIIEGCLADGVRVGGLDSNPEPTATAPLVEDIDTTIRATRVYPDLGFTGKLAGAVHALVITGELTV